MNDSTPLLEVNETGRTRYVSIIHLGGSAVAECILDRDLVHRKSGEAPLLPVELR